MILTVTLNPLLERRFYFDKVINGTEPLRAKSLHLSVGGKGVNVSRQLNNLNKDNLAFLFLGGNNGKIIRRLLREEKINYSIIQIVAENREAALAIDESEPSVSTFFSPNPNISISESDEFKLKLEKIIPNMDIVIFSGGTPCDNANDIFPFGIEICKKYDKISILDTYGEHLYYCLKKGPTVVHNNVLEVEHSLDIKLSTEEEIIEYLKNLYSQGIKQTFLTNGASYFFSSNHDFVYKVFPPNTNEKDSTGSGDSFVAGAAFCLDNCLSFEETLRRASSIGAKNAEKFSTSNVSLNEAFEYADLIKIESVGKKIVNYEIK